MATTEELCIENGIKYAYERVRYQTTANRRHTSSLYRPRKLLHSLLQEQHRLRRRWQVIAYRAINDVSRRLRQIASLYMR
jgi:hypothetical protein